MDENIDMWNRMEIFCFHTDIYTDNLKTCFYNEGHHWDD